MGAMVRSAGCTSTYAVEDVELDGAVVAVTTTNGLAVQVLDRLQMQTMGIALVDKAAHHATGTHSRRTG